MSVFCNVTRVCKPVHTERIERRAAMPMSVKLQKSSKRVAACAATYPKMNVHATEKNRGEMSPQQEN